MEYEQFVLSTLDSFTLWLYCTFMQLLHVYFKCGAKQSYLYQENDWLTLWYDTQVLPLRRRQQISGENRTLEWRAMPHCQQMEGCLLCCQAPAIKIRIKILTSMHALDFKMTEMVACWPCIVVILKLESNYWIHVTIMIFFDLPNFLSNSQSWQPQEQFHCYVAEGGRCSWEGPWSL